MLTIHMKLLFWSMILLTSIGMHAQPHAIDSAGHAVYVADAKVQIHDLKNFTSAYIDSSNRLSIQDISSGKFDNRFQPLSDKAPLVAQPHITYWLKVAIRTSGDIDNWWLLLYSNSTI